MSQVRIYHNPRCSKSRATLELLRAHGIEPAITEYLADPPDAAELDRILSLLRLEPRQLMRSSEPEYTELGLANDHLPRTALIDAMVKHPRLIQRPIVVVDGCRAVLGRPPEAVLDILPSR